MMTELNFNCNWWLNAWFWAALSGVGFFLLLGWWSRRWPDYFSPRVCCIAYGLGMLRMVIPLPAPWKLEISGAGWILIVLGIGAICRMGVTVYRSRLVYRRIIGQEQLLKERLHGLFLEEKGAAGVQSRPVLICSALPLSPMLIGWLRPLLFLPAEWAEKSSDLAMRQILRHELEHLRNGDLRMIWGWNLMRSLYWFVPVMGRFERNFRLQREFRCDEATLTNSHYSAESYVGTLLELAGAPVGWTRELRGAAPLMENRSELSMRVSRLLEPGGKGHPLPAILSIVLLLAALVGAGCFQVVSPEKLDNAETMIEKALDRLDPDGIIRPRKSLYMSGNEVSRMVKAPASENYPEFRSTFERYEDPEHFYLRSLRITLVSSPAGSWNLTQEGIGFKSDTKFSDSMNLISLLQEVRSRMPVRDSEHPEKLWIVVQKKPRYKVCFAPDYRVEKVEIGDTVWEYEDYRTIAGGYLPTQITSTSTSTLWAYRQVYTVNEIEAGSEPKPGWFKKPRVLQPPLPVLTIGNWKNVGMMSRNLVAMRKIYGQEMKFCLNLIFRTPDDDEIIMNQITFADEESAERYLENPAADAKIAARWRIGKFVQELEGPITPVKQAFVDEIKRSQEIATTPGMPK